ncbi:MAG: DUF1232 domain-containing protein [Planctomycetota bacterium]|nr:DUF1232 domain-containing protein [Planctomycetota bacterium]
MKSGDDLAIKAIIVGALLYFISPFDIVPDFLPGVGYFDDIGVIALVANQVKNAIAKFMGKG